MRDGQSEAAYAAAMVVSAVPTSGAFDRRTTRIAVTIEARMTSTRLPGKVLADVGGQPALALMIRRLSRSVVNGSICVATTTNDEDDGVAALARDLGVSYYRGSEQDVLGRVLGAAESIGADVIVETTGDCPLIDAGLLDDAVLEWFSADVHYCSNLLQPGLPSGLDVQVFSTAVLAEVAALTSDPRDREHVSLYIYEHPDRYRVSHVPVPADLNRPDWRWTVDTSDDLAFVRAVVEGVGPDATAREMVHWLDAHPDVLALNAHVAQKPVR